MSDDLDEALDRLTLPQRIALAKATSLAMSADSARRASLAKPSDVAFSQPFTLGDRGENADAGKRLADMVNRRASPGGEEAPM